MKILLSVFLLTFLSLPLHAQTITFGKNDDIIKVAKGSSVTINADTAYIVSTARAQYINKKLDQLDSIQILYNDLVDNRNELLNELKKAQKTLSKLLNHLQGDSTLLNANIVEIVANLDHTLTNLKKNNEELKKNNKALKTEIKHLEDLVKQLRNQTKGIWWNNVADKIVVFAGGVGLGLLIALL